MDDQTSIYRVEVSGWDRDERFFVERAALEWRDGGQKRVLIHRNVRNGAMLFIRLLENSSPSSSFPVAYRVREVCDRDGGTAYEVTLRQIWPSPDGQCTGPTAMLDAARSRRLGLN
ncbi:MAG TPA: hypothetical protein VKG84_01400 [Candidatus Acidoferrales bacterium]|nr:hypothetical protein [Candidatus Acidoferrales bacterium]